MSIRQGSVLTMASLTTHKVSTVILVIVYGIFTSQVNGSRFDPSLIARELQKFANDALGVDELQTYFNRLQYQKQNIDGKSITPELAVELKDKFQTRFKVAKRLKEAVEASYARAPKPTTATECCKIDDSTLTYDERFRSEVDLNNICLKISGSAPPNPIHLDAEEVLKVMKDIHEKNPFIKWQYFGSEEGVMTNFPVFNDTAPCTGYDPRYRPFYVETATPEAKDVVLVIDTSASMTGVKLAIAKEAAETVLETMNPKDQVNVVSFNEKASTYRGLGVSSCYSERLALAVPQNRNSLKKYIDGLIGHDKSIYRVGFEKAFALFKASADSDKTKKRVILFLTDGDPTDSDQSLIFKTIRDRNLELNNSVVIFTFGIGEVNRDLLIDLAIQNTTEHGYTRNVSVGDITHGQYYHVEQDDLDTLRSKMASYYNFLPPARLDRPVVSVPYIDAFGTGLLMSITLPCYDSRDKFIGVAGTDINIEDLLSDITFFNQGQTTYAFMISETGRTLIHPLLPAPTDAYEDPIFMDIRTLEPEPEFLEVFDSMSKGLSGSKTFMATRYLPRGADVKEGVRVKQLNSTYFWSPVVKTEFSIGVVVPVSHQNEVLNTLQIPKGYSFQYNRIDLDPPKNPCSHFGKIVTKDTTVVKFAPGAFLDPYKYIGMHETKIDVQKLNDYMMGKTTWNEYRKLKQHIRNTVIATWNVEKLWLRDKTELTQYLVWRYIGTANGVFRITPGGVSRKTMDPRQRPWYINALSHSGHLTLTTPYLDLGGAGVVITAARTLYRGESSDNVLGVMGADFPLRHFYRLLTKVYPKCADTTIYACFIIDHSGFLIMHEDFLLSSSKAEHLEHIHITQKEKLIATDLIRNGFLKKNECRNIEKIHKQGFYEVQLPPDGVNALQRQNGCKYQLGHIIGTNVFLGVAVRDSLCAADTCACASDNECSSSILSLTCECPCISPLEFNYCSSQFPNSSLPICPTFPPSGQLDDAQQPPLQKNCLDKCFDPHCSERNSSQWCDGIVSCYWCEKNKDGIPLKKSYCASSERCFRGIESATKKNEIDGAECISTITPNTKQPLGGGLSTGAIAGIAVGCTILGILLLVALFYLGIQRYRNSEGHVDANVSTQDIAETSPKVHSPVPDVLVMSIPNQAFKMYEDPDEMELPQHVPAAPNLWPPPYDEIQHQRAAEMATTEQMSPVFNSEQPALPEKQRKWSSSSNPAPPVPNTRRPSVPLASRLRSVTDITQPPPVPNTRRPSDGTLPSMSRILSRSESNPAQPISARRQQWEGAGRDFSVRRRPVEAQPPPLVPRERRPSEDDISRSRASSGQAGQNKPQYSNIPPISEAKERPNGEDNDDDDDDDDDVDAAGYVKCVAPKEDPRKN